MYRTIVAAAVVLGAAIAPSLAAADRARSGTDPPGRSTISAEEFLSEAAAGNRFEIVTGQLAQQRPESSDIKALGAEFVDDHTALLEQGAKVAASLGLTVPDGLTPEQQRIVARLRELNGSAFDRAWLFVQLKAHRQALRLHLRAAIRADKPEVRMLAQGALPVITHHFGALLDIAQASPDGSKAGDDS